MWTMPLRKAQVFFYFQRKREVNAYIVDIMTRVRQKAVGALGPGGGHGALSAEAIGLVSRR